MQKVSIERYSNVNHDWQQDVLVLKRRNYVIQNNVSIGGDAPKEFIRVYEYGRVKRHPSSKWTAYIAKVGHKWYPIESITEYLLNQIGEVLGLKMAKSRLAILGGQLFFLSEYFLDSRQFELVHGADIYAGYLMDKDLVEEIESKALAREFFTFQFAQSALEAVFGVNAASIVDDFVQLLFFDAIVGNNDRHFYNWAVLRHIENQKMPSFAPIYDTARGLFWNESEAKINQWIQHPNTLGAKIKKYADNSMPKTGWEGHQQLNHFQLIEQLVNHNIYYKDMLTALVDEGNEKRIVSLIANGFTTLLSQSR